MIAFSYVARLVDQSREALKAKGEFLQLVVEDVIRGALLLMTGLEAEGVMREGVQVAYRGRVDPRDRWQDSGAVSPTATRH